jgi:hypothetical protein
MPRQPEELFVWADKAAQEFDGAQVIHLIKVCGLLTPSPTRLGEREFFLSGRGLFQTAGIRPALPTLAICHSRQRLEGSSKGGFPRNPKRHIANKSPQVIADPETPYWGSPANREGFQPRALILTCPLTTEQELQHGYKPRKHRLTEFSRA